MPNMSMQKNPMPEQAPEEAGEGAHLLGWILGGLGGVVLLLALATWLL